MAITPETMRLAAQSKRATTAIVDTHTRELIRAWANAWDDLNAAFERELAWLTKLGNWADGMDAERIRQLVTSMSEVIDTRLAELINTTGAQVGAANRRIINQTIADMRDVIESQVPPSHWPGFVRPVHPDVLNWVAHRSTQQITVRHYYLQHEATRAMKRELMAGLAIGDNPNDAAKRMVDRVEGAFNGGLTRATVIARTEMLDAHRAAALEQRKANADVLQGWYWMAALTERTCPSCWAMHGTWHPTDEPGPIDHHQGRCTAVPQTKTWQELGFDADGEPAHDVRPSREEADKAWNKLSEDAKREILGPKRYDAYQARAYPMDAWPQRREHWDTHNGVTRRAWRDSMHTSPAPEPPAGGWPTKTGPWGDGSVTITGLNKTTTDAVEHVVEQIKGLHDTPTCTYLRVTDAELKRRPGLGGYYRGGAGTIHLTEDSQILLNAIAHETGHLLDHKHLGTGARYASDTRQTEAWKSWYRTVKATETFKTLAASDTSWAKYARTPRELWARSYAQWVAQQSGSKRMAREIAAMRKNTATAQMVWADDEFEALSEAITAIIKELHP